MTFSLIPMSRRALTSIHLYQQNQLMHLQVCKFVIETWIYTIHPRECPETISCTTSMHIIKYQKSIEDVAFEVKTLKVHSIHWAANQFPTECNNVVYFDSSLENLKTWRPFNLNAFESLTFEPLNGTNSYARIHDKFLTSNPFFTFDLVRSFCPH